MGHVLESFENWHQSAEGQLVAAHSPTSSALFLWPKKYASAQDRETLKRLAEYFGPLEDQDLTDIATTLQQSRDWFERRISVARVYERSRTSAQVVPVLHNFSVFDSFFDLKALDQAAVFAHEITHLAGWTHDYGYMQNLMKPHGNYEDDEGNVIRSSSVDKVHNAGTYEGFLRRYYISRDYGISRS